MCTPLHPTATATSSNPSAAAPSPAAASPPRGESVGWDSALQLLCRCIWRETTSTTSATLSPKAILLETNRYRGWQPYFYATGCRVWVRGRGVRRWRRTRGRRESRARWVGGESHLRAAAGVVEVGEILASERGGEEMEATLGCVCTCSWAARDLLALSRSLSIARALPTFCDRRSASSACCRLWKRTGLLPQSPYW